MITISAVLYFLSRHPIWVILCGVATIMIGAISPALSETLRAIVNENPFWMGVILIPLLFGILNLFTISRINAAFLNRFVASGSAVITRARQTSAKLNEEYIWVYDALLKTADGSDVKLTLNSMTVCIYPPGNEAGIPPTGERFYVKYTPGFERNVVILSETSTYGKRSAMQLASADVNHARLRLEANTDNAAFRQEFHDVLEAFLKQYGSAVHPAVVRRYRAELRGLEDLAMRRQRFR